MTDATLQDAIEAEYETELSRLGSSKSLYALTGGELETDAVLAALADAAATAAATFEDWTDDPEAGDLFLEAAETGREHADRIAESADEAEPVDAPTPADEVLRGLQSPAARLGGLLAWTLLTDETLAQGVGFFVGNADPKAADRFRDLRSDVAELRERTLDVLEEADDEAARAAASDVVEAAYAHYANTLEGMGVKVKPVC